MKKLLLTSIAALFLATGTARAGTGPGDDRQVIGECGELENSPPCPKEVVPRRTDFRPQQEIWQCNDLRVTVTSPQLGIVNYDIAGSVWGGINFTFDDLRHQLYKGQWPCVLVRQ